MFRSPLTYVRGREPVCTNATADITVRPFDQAALQAGGDVIDFRRTVRKGIRFLSGWGDNERRRIEQHRSPGQRTRICTLGAVGRLQCHPGHGIRCLPRILAGDFSQIQAAVP